MLNPHHDIKFLKEIFETFLKHPLTDNEKENELFQYPLVILEQLLKLFREDEQYEACRLIQNVLKIKNTPPVGTILTNDQVQAIHDSAEHAELKNQLKALLVSVKFTGEQYGIPKGNFSFIKNEIGTIDVKEIKEKY